MANVPWEHTHKTAATNQEISDSGVIFGGVLVHGGTLGVVTVRDAAAGNTVAVATLTSGATNTGQIEVGVSQNGIALPALHVEFSSAMNGTILWRSQGSG